jgi:outer membrane protein assembly factor BamB
MNARLWLLAAVLIVGPAAAADWPQWRGPNRDAKVAGFDAPASWPKELTKKWKVTIGDGVATPALVGDKLYTFARQGGDEVVRCLDAATGNKVWEDKYPASAPTGGAARYQGPRSSPTVVDGKVITFGVDSTLSCMDAASGSKIWRKESLGEPPMFFVSCSPIVVDGAAPGAKIVIAEYGREEGGGLAAYDLANGKRQWFWDGDGATYGSAILMTVDGAQVLVTPTAENIVALNPADGKLLWKSSFPAPRMTYNAATPVVVDGQTILYSGNGRGRGTKEFKLAKSDGKVDAKELWSTGDLAVKFNTPVAKNGYLYGISDRNQLFCMSAADGKSAWAQPIGGRGGYGSVVDAGSVMFALTEAGDLIVFEPNPKEFKKVASYKVAAGDTYAYPVIADKRIFIKDKNDVTLWTIE